jgi:hypothetical protein
MCNTELRSELKLGGRGRAWLHVKDWLLVVLPPETGLFGSALGFCFGSRGSP